MDNEETIITEPASPVEEYTNVISAIWEDFGSIHIHTTPDEAKWLLVWQVTGMEEAGRLEYESMQEALVNGLGVVDGTPDQILVKPRYITDESFVSLPVTVEDTDELIEAITEARETPAPKSVCECIFGGIASFFGIKDAA